MLAPYAALRPACVLAQLLTMYRTRRRRLSKLRCRCTPISYEKGSTRASSAALVATRKPEGSARCWPPADSNAEELQCIVRAQQPSAERTETVPPSLYVAAFQALFSSCGAGEDAWATSKWSWSPDLPLRIQCIMSRQLQGCQAQTA